MKSLLSIKEINNIGIFKFFTLFLEMWKIGAMKKADRIGDRIEPCPIPVTDLSF